MDSGEQVVAEFGVCAACSTQLALHAVECPACRTPVHTPMPRSEEHRVRWRKYGGPALGLVVLVAGKFKFLLLGLTKAKTFFSMFAFFGVYWTAFGWPLALGLVLSIYVHEMGHVAMLRRLGIGAGAPLFIPGVGAFVMLERPVSDPRQNAAIGLAGPVWGLGAGLAAFGVHLATGEMIWLAIAQLTGWINLFNLIPIWQLDGARGFHALTRLQRWAVVGAMAATGAITGQKLLLIVGGVAAWSAFRMEKGPGDHRAFATFLVLVAVLSWLSIQIAADVG
ncbi:MAG TPA: hypothetical protein VM430_10620 [Microbacterium sp.]|nr:hypothetical protein [Microbacterium sp.]